MRDIERKIAEILNYRRSADKSFDHHLWFLRKAWQDARFEDALEGARSLMHLAEDCKLHWGDLQDEFDSKEEGKEIADTN